MPFRYVETLIRSDAHNWARRVKVLFPLASVDAIQLMGKDGRPAVDSYGAPIMKRPNVKMLRHTFAVGSLSAGIREETVAKMLGHKSVEMVREHYGPWCKQRDEAHIREVFTVMKPVNAPAAPNSKSTRKRQPRLTQ